MKRDPEKFTPPPLVESVCTECGALVPSEFDTCDGFFLSVLLRSHEASVHPQLYRAVVDTYGMQHPARSCKSAKSYAAHLSGLCCSIEYGSSELVYAALQRWLNGPVENIGIARPSDLQFLGGLTIRYPSEALSDQEFEHRVREWGKDVWKAYESQHGIARKWMREALGE